MNSSRNGRRTEIAIVAAALLTSIGFAASTRATEPAPGATTLPARPPIVLAQAASKPVSYSNEQAKRGEVQFKETCVDCHGDDLRGGLNGGPPLRGVMFNMDFGNGAPASSLFLFMSTQMPPEAPGRFSDATYAELMAYVLQVNGYEAGAPLPSNSAALDNLALTK